jgi:microsomal dipeptidase-like Zn-dependent dipeptidase
VRPRDWAAVTGQAAHIPVRAPIVSSHQEPSSLHVDREKSRNVQDEHAKKYPRQGSNL